MMTVFDFLFGICAGASSAAGVFGFLMKVDVYPRMIGSSHTEKKVFFYEWLIVCGVILGGIVTEFPDLPLHFGYWFVVLWGLLMGIFVGCVSIALAEVLNVFPIIFHKMKLDKNLSIYVIAMALGKMAGSFWYFYNRIQP